MKLKDVGSEELEKVFLEHDGGSIRYAPLDIDISVPGIVCDVTGACSLTRGPNAETIAAMEEARRRGLESVTLDELKAEIDAMD